MLASSVQAVVVCNATAPRVCTLVLFIIFQYLGFSIFLRRIVTKGSMLINNNLRAWGFLNTVDPVGRACLTDLDYSNSCYVIIMYTSCYHLKF